jgi:predicted DNA-binding mobile mystery protein A
MENQKLIVDQIDRKISQFQGLSRISLPDQGWIRSIRIALNMTLKQLGKRLNITPPSVKEIEDREKNGTISINILKKFGEAMDMKFVYGFIPQKGSISEIINQQAYEVAKNIVLRTAKNMELEDQLVLNDQIEKAINEKKNEIIRELPKYLWE